MVNNKLNYMAAQAANTLEIPPWQRPAMQRGHIKMSRHGTGVSVIMLLRANPYPIARGQESPEVT